MFGRFIPMIYVTLSQKSEAFLVLSSHKPQLLTSMEKIPSLPSIFGKAFENISINLINVMGESKVVVDYERNNKLSKHYRNKCGCHPKLITVPVASMKNKSKPWE